MERANRDACIALTETWLDKEVPVSKVSLDNFSILWADRTRQLGKVIRGGICFYITRRCFDYIKIHSRVCTPDVKMLTTGLHPC